jgi:hypothetical protein
LQSVYRLDTSVRAGSVPGVASDAPPDAGLF